MRLRLGFNFFRVNRLEGFVNAQSDTISNREKKKKLGDRELGRRLSMLSKAAPWRYRRSQMLRPVLNSFYSLRC